jgi:diaminohydroxyphosphoribosylaminopyrimidine deaminase/5-amino-6-(5-phosphoribosylamino)uracil reductase
MPGLSALDRDRLAEALALAEGSIGLSDPNPRVGCVIGNPHGEVFGRGFTQQAGGPHAEVMAMREAAAAGIDLRGATAWVTLEPCAHHGRTPPCADALVRAGLARVVVAVQDPFEQVAGAGMARLREAGIAVDLADRDLAQAARELNIGFFSRIERGRPWVRLKVAISLDGRVALPDGRSQWITGEAARIDTHAWRRRAQAVVTGVGTVVADDPRLDVRLVPTTLQPLRVVLDPRLRTPAGARVLAVPGQACVVHANDLTAAEAAAWRGDAEQLPLRHGAQGLDLGGLLADLARRQVNEVHLEGGPRFNAAWLQQGRVDELLVYVAPRLIGPGLPLADLPALPDLSGAASWRPLGVSTLGSDLRWRLRQDVSKFLTNPTTEAGDGG